MENNNYTIALLIDTENVSSKYLEALKEELAELDIEYDTMKTMWEAELEVLNNRAEAEKQNLATSAQDTGLLN